jgi:hypothetical protein
MFNENSLSAAQIRPAQLYIQIRIGARSRILIKNGPVTVSGTGNFSDRNLANMHKALRGDLEQFKEDVEHINQSPANAIKALRRLKERGGLILNDLFGSDGKKLREAQELCGVACPNWGKSGWRDNTVTPEMVEVDVDPGDGIPVEILPLFEFGIPKGFKQMNSDEQIWQLARSFLGFSTIVKRRIGPDPPRFRALENRTGLPIRLFLNNDVLGAGPVKQYFDNPAAFRCDGPWPDSKAPSNLQDFTETLAQNLWYPAKSFTGQPHHPPDQVFHFHCHCDTRAELSGEHALIFHAGNLFGSERRVDLDRLRYALYILRHEEPKHDEAGPLVFLNACGSAGVDPSGATSFPQLFLESGMCFLGVIGTEASIPDWFARKFAERFYTRFVEGVEIGTSLYQTRWELLRVFKNPLGILYTLYAEPEICVRSTEDSKFQQSRLRPEPERRT